VLKHFTGNCHVYVDAATEAMEPQVCDVCVNAKTSYPGGAGVQRGGDTCFPQGRGPRLLQKVCEDLPAKGVEIRGDDERRASSTRTRKPATATTGTRSTSASSSA
jgi:gamma-glutamyl phosphate reductase